MKILDYLKRLFMSGDGTASKWSSLGVMAPLLGGAALVVNALLGWDVQQDDITQLLTAGDAVANAIIVFATYLINMWARVRATTNLNTGKPLTK